MNLRALLTSALLLPACAAQRASTTPTPEPSQGSTAAPATEPAQGSTAAPATGLQRGAGPIGTPHPFVFQAAAKDGRWVVACQAREDTDGDGKLEVLYGQHGDNAGDALAPYLFLEPGEGERLEDFLTSDPTGRYLVVVRGGSLRLFDTYARTDTELAAPGTFPDSNTPGSALPVSFSRDGKRLLQVVLSGPDKKASAVLVNLEDASRQEIQHGPGELGQASLEPDGRWAVFGVLTKDTDGDGKLTWPTLNTSLSPRRCRGPIRSYSRYGFTGDRPSSVMRRVSGGPVVQTNDMLRPVGDLMLKRGEKGELFAEDASGQRTEWVPASCGARVIHADLEHEQLLVACTAQGNALELHGARVHQPLGLSVEPPARGDQLSGEPTRLYPVTPASPAGGEQSAPNQSLVDLETRTVHPVPVPGRVYYTDGTRALVVQASEAGPASKLWFVDTATGEKRELGTVEERTSIEVAGNLVYIWGVLVDMSTGQLLGKVEGDLDVLDTQGRTLRIEEMSWAAPVGPLQWTPAVTAPAQPK